MIIYAAFGIIKQYDIFIAYIMDRPDDQRSI